MFEKGIDWRASLAALTPDIYFLSISFTRTGVESSEPLKQEVSRNERNSRTDLNKQSCVGSLKFGPGSCKFSLKKGSGPIHGH